MSLSQYEPKMEYVDLRTAMLIRDNCQIFDGTFVPQKGLPLGTKMQNSRNVQLSKKAMQIGVKGQKGRQRLSPACAMLSYNSQNIQIGGRQNSKFSKNKSNWENDLGKRPDIA